MVNKTQLKILKEESVKGWNDYRKKHRNIKINLSGANLSRKNLEGADFSEADIRSTNFSGSNLKKANFSGVKCGLQSRWLIFLFILGLVLGIIVGLIAVIEFGEAGAIIGFVGFGVIGLGAVGIVIGILRLAILGLGLAAGLLIGVLAILGLGGKLETGILITNVITLKEFLDAGLIILIYAIGLGLVLVLLKGTKINPFSIAFITIGITNFRDANLSDANFTSAKLRSTDLRGANLTRVRWYKAKMLTLVILDNGLGNQSSV